MQYPIILESTHLNLVVCFHKEKHGTIIKGTITHKGERLASGDYADCWEMNQFETEPYEEPKPEPLYYRWKKVIGDSVMVSRWTTDPIDQLGWVKIDIPKTFEEIT